MCNLIRIQFATHTFYINDLQLTINALDDLELFSRVLSDLELILNNIELTVDTLDDLESASHASGQQAIRVVGVKL